jgi:hypothetical protein
MAPEMRLAAAAAAALAFSLLLPWYSAAPGGGNFTAFNVFTFVEAAVLLVAAGVLYLVWARAKRRAFHLPGGDGAVISIAGAWAALLLLWRMFDRPDLEKAVSVGIQWGIFAALISAAALVVAGQRIRAAHRPEPRNPADELDWEHPARRSGQTRTAPRDHTEVTRVLQDKPSWEGEPSVLGERREPAPAPEPEPGAEPPPERRERRRRDGDRPAPESQDRLF